MMSQSLSKLFTSFCIIIYVYINLFKNDILKTTLQDEAAELEEYLAKKQKRGKQSDDKPLEEKTVLHSKK